MVLGILSGKSTFNTFNNYRFIYFQVPQLCIIRAVEKNTHQSFSIIYHEDDKS